MSEDEGRVAAARLDEVEAHGRIAQNIEPKDEAEEKDDVEAHSSRVDAPKLDAPKLD
jgi:hypothetical protein